MSYEIPALVAGLLIGAILAYYILSSRISAKASSQALSHAEHIASQLFESQNDQLDRSIRSFYDAELGKWKATTLAQAVEEARSDAVNTARVVLRGKIAEQMAPMLPEFLANFQPADAKFIGSPIDYLIFKNMNKGPDAADPIELILLDVKTGKSQLTTIQKKIQAAVEDKRIRFEVLRIGAGTDSEPSTTPQSTTETIPMEEAPLDSTKEG